MINIRSLLKEQVYLLMLNINNNSPLQENNIADNKSTENKLKTKTITDTKGTINYYINNNNENGLQNSNITYNIEAITNCMNNNDNYLRNKTQHESNNNPNIVDNIEGNISNSINTNIKLTYNKYKRCYKSNAYIIALGNWEYEIIIPKTPAIYSYTTFTGIEWNKKEYKFTSPLQTYRQLFLKSIVKLE